jgi:hypothetical protein
MTARNGGIQGRLDFGIWERAAAAVAATPEKSDRAIAGAIGVSHTTVQKARKSVGNLLPAGKRVGRDGKFYPAKPIRQEPVAAATAVANVAPRRQRSGNIVIGSTIAAVGIGLSVAGMFASTRYATTTAADADRFLFAAVAVSADLLSLLLPSGIVAIWRARRRGLGLIAMPLWIAAVLVTSTNLGGYFGVRSDSFISSRQSETIERSMVLDRLSRLRTERKQITESRSTGEITIVIRNATARKVDDERLALQQARRRDQIDADLANIEQTVGNLPNLSQADPAAQTLAETLTLLTGGYVVGDSDMLRRLRLMLLLALPLLAGLIFAIGIALASTAKGRTP